MREKEKIFKEGGRERTETPVSQQRRGAKRQSGFMIFSQRHFSRDTLCLKTTSAGKDGSRL